MQSQNEEHNLHGAGGDAAFRFFEQFTNFEARPGSRDEFKLDLMYSLLDFFGNPQNDLEFIHVAGSKGKGSTSAYIAAMMRLVTGEPVGIYGSPHVFDYRERIRFTPTRGPQASDSRGFFADEIYSSAISEIRNRLDVFIEQQGRPTTFELLTLCAFLVFRKAGLHMAVIEVGLGGRLDSTNVIQPILSVITPLELEHSAYLGDTLTEIAMEKGGIIKPGIPVVTSPQKPEALAELHHIATDRGSKLIIAGVDGSQLRAASVVETNLHLKKELPGYLLTNARTAVAAVETLLPELKVTGWDSLTEGSELRPDITDILSSTRLPGRFETRNLPNGHRLVLDAAHTPDAITVLCDGIHQAYPGQVKLIFSALSDKKIRRMMEILRPLSDEIIITGTGNFKRSDLPALAAEAADLWGNDAIFVHPLMEDALEAATSKISDAGADGDFESGTKATILICGSFYLLGEAYRVLGYPENGAGS